MENPRNLAEAVATFRRDHERDVLTVKHGPQPAEVARLCGCAACTLWLWIVETPNSVQSTDRGGT